MSNFEVAAELTWENGQLAMHEFPTKPTWGGTEDTLESLVHQATLCNNQSPNLLKQQQKQKTESIGSVVASSGEKRTEKSTQGERFLYRRKASNSLHEHKGDGGPTNRSACGSANITFCKDNDPTTMTWVSFKSPKSTKATKTTYEDSDCHGGSENQEEERETKGESETGRSSSGRRGRTAAVHNQSERRRRDRINQKMKTLQKLVPNSCKTDKASMLDEVIDYLKQLQAQVQIFSGYMPHLMMPLEMQQQVQMSLLARMRMGTGMGVGMGMLDMSSIACAAAPQPMTMLTPPSSAAATTTSTFLHPPLAVPSVIPNFTPTTQIRKNGSNGSVSVPSQDP